MILPKIANKKHVQRGYREPAVRILGGIVLLIPMLTVSSAPARDPRVPCDDRCLGKLYKEMGKRAQRQGKLGRNRSRKELLRDVKKNNDLTKATRAILQEQIKDGFSQFDIPNTTVADPGEIPTVKPLSLREIWAEGPSQLEKVDCAVSPCTLPYELDVPGGSVFLLFNLLALSVDDALEYVNQDNEKFLRVYLNGSLLTQESDFKIYPGGNCGEPPFPGCIVLLIPGKVWYPSTPPWPVWNVDIEFWRTRSGIEFECPLTIVPPASLQSFWLATIGSTVISSRCTTCHAMDTVENIQARHHENNSIFVNPVLIASLLVPGKFVYHCQNCHEDALTYLGPTSSFPEKIWATPTEALNIDWAELINDNPNTWPSVICQRMTTNLPTHALRHQHFHGDSRLFWAVAKGELPPPSSSQTLPTAAPMNYDKFLQDFDRWNDAGAPCP